MNYFRILVPQLFPLTTQFAFPASVGGFLTRLSACFADSLRALFPAQVSRSYWRETDGCYPKRAPNPSLPSSIDSRKAVKR